MAASMGPLELQYSVRKLESTENCYYIMEAETGHDRQGITHQKRLCITPVVNWIWLYAEKDTAVTRVYYYV